MERITSLTTWTFALFIALASQGFATQDAPEPILETRPATEVTLSDLKWQARVVIVFADSPFDPAFTEQIDLLRADPLLLAERDVIVVTDTDPEALSALRTKFRPKGFMWVLVGKDGEVKLRKPFPWDLRELSRSIDKMPLRQQEMRR